MTQVLIGQNTESKSTLTNADSGAPVTPSSVTIYVLHPDGVTKDTYTTGGGTVTTPTTGTYEATFQPATAGVYRWSLKGSGGERDAGAITCVADPAY